MENYFNWPERQRIVREAAPELVARSYLIFLPGPYASTFWQPWVKGYYGEYYRFYVEPNAWPRYVWIDQNLKNAMRK